MKKALSIILVLAMVLVMAIPSFASNTTISTVVPDEHTVTVVYNDGGYVLVNGKLCPDGTQFKINRFGEIDLGAVFKNGYHLDTIEINGTDVTEQYIDGNLKITEGCERSPQRNCDFYTLCKSWSSRRIFISSRYYNLSLF